MREQLLIVVMGSCFCIFQLLIYQKRISFLHENKYKIL